MAPKDVVMEGEGGENNWKNRDTLQRWAPSNWVDGCTTYSDGSEERRSRPTNTILFYNFLINIFIE